MTFHILPVPENVPRYSIEQLPPKWTVGGRTDGRWSASLSFIQRYFDSFDHDDRPTDGPPGHARDLCLLGPAAGHAG